MTPGRRLLQFNTTDEIISEVDRLRGGCKTVGAWSPARIYGHLASVIEAVLKSTPPPPGTPPPATQFSEEKRTQVFESGVLPEGVPQPDWLVGFEPASEGEEADRLSAALAAFRTAPGPFGPHRYFGALSREQWDRLNCIHCAHHLSFAIPDAT